MATYPTLGTGATTQLPFVRITRFHTTKSAVESGKRYTYADRALQLMGWELVYSALTHTERAEIDDFFRDRGGRYETFDFPDPQTGTLYTKVRFDMDELEIEYLGPSHNSMRVRLIEHT